jgi:hypothetical protein
LRCLKKLKIELLYDPTITLLQIYSKQYKLVYKKGACTFMFCAALFTVGKLRKQPRYPTTYEWIKKM